MKIQRKDSCPLNGKFLHTSIAWKADVIPNKDSPIYHDVSDKNHNSILQSTSRTRLRVFQTYLATTRQRHQLHPKIRYASSCFQIEMCHHSICHPCLLEK